MLPVGCTRLPGSRRSQQKIDYMRKGKARQGGLANKLSAAAAATCRGSCHNDGHLPVKPEEGGGNDCDGQHVDARVGGQPVLSSSSMLCPLR
jgi:hypothetical protein